MTELEMRLLQQLEQQQRDSEQLGCDPAEGRERDTASRVSRERPAERGGVDETGRARRALNRASERLGQTIERVMTAYQAWRVHQQERLHMPPSTGNPIDDTATQKPSKARQGQEETQHSMPPRRRRSGPGLG